MYEVSSKALDNGSKDARRLHSQVLVTFGGAKLFV